jgi:hypothetical protein
VAEDLKNILVRVVEFRFYSGLTLWGFAPNPSGFARWLFVNPKYYSKMEHDFQITVRQLL